MLTRFYFLEANSIVWFLFPLEANSVKFGSKWSKLYQVWFKVSKGPCLCVTQRPRPSGHVSFLKQTLSSLVQNEQKTMFLCYSETQAFLVMLTETKPNLVGFDGEIKPIHNWV